MHQMAQRFLIRGRKRKVDAVPGWIVELNGHAPSMFAARGAFCTRGESSSVLRDQRAEARHLEREAKSQRQYA